MKRFLLLFLIICITLPLCACGSPSGEVAEPVQESVQTQEPSIADEMYDKYGDLIESLETGDYEAASGIIDAINPNSSLISITTDNFYEYYDAVFQNCESATVMFDISIMNGQIESIDRYWGPYYDIHLKSEFTSSEENQLDVTGNVNAEFTCTYAYRKLLSINWDDWSKVINVSWPSFELSDESFEDVTQAAMEYLSADNTPASSEYIHSGTGLEDLGFHTPEPYSGLTLVRYVNGQFTKIESLGRWDSIDNIYVLDLVDLKLNHAKGAIKTEKSA